MKLLFSFLLVFSTCTVSAQLSKEQVIENINDWYAENSEQYTLEIKGEEVIGKITRYHPGRPEEKNDLIEVSYRGMQIQLMFAKPLEEITTHKDSLQKYFMYTSVTDIYNEIPAVGWNIYPKTPQSSLNGEGVVFTSGGNSISLTIDWSSYTVFGYKDAQKCHDELSIADGSVSEECLVSVRKKIPLKIEVKKAKLK